jgi:hypothetical protein
MFLGPSSKKVRVAANFSLFFLHSPPLFGFVVDMANTDVAHVGTESLESEVKFIFLVRLEIITGVLKIQLL